jgi:hypothetical protein
MPEHRTTYLNRVTITITDEFYNAIKESAEQQRTSIEALIMEAVEKKLGLKPSPRLSVQELREYLLQEMKLYAADGLNSKSFLTATQDNMMFVVADVAVIQKKRFAEASLIAHIIKDVIVIERDQNDKSLVDALLQAGVPRSQIILAYAGEPVPESA